MTIPQAALLFGWLSPASLAYKALTKHVLAFCGSCPPKGSDSDLSMEAMCVFRLWLVVT